MFSYGSCGCHGGDMKTTVFFKVKSRRFLLHCLWRRKQRFSPERWYIPICQTAWRHIPEGGSFKKCLTPQKRAVVHKLTVFQIVKTFLEFYRDVFTRACQITLLNHINPVHSLEIACNSPYVVCNEWFPRCFNTYQILLVYSYLVSHFLKIYFSF